MNQKMKMFERFEQNTTITVEYRGLEITCTIEELLSKADSNGNGHFLGSSGVYTIGSINCNGGSIRVGLEAVATMITSGTVVDEITEYIQKKDKGMAHIQIDLGVTQIDNNTYLDNKVGFVKIAENLAIRKGLFTIEDSTVLRMGKDFMRFNKVDKYAATLEILSLCYGRDNEQGKYAIEGDIFMKMDAYNSYKFYIKQGFSSYYDLESNAVIDSVEGFRRYRAFGASPSNDRQEVIYFIDVTNGVDRANKILDELTWGAYSIDLGKKVSYEKLAKMSTRWFQWMAPSISLGYTNRFAVYFGAFNENRLDGMSWASSEAMAKHIEETKGYRIAPESLNGVFWQGRPVQTKAGYVNIPERSIWTMIDYLDPNPIIVDWDEVTPGLKADIYSGKYNGRVIVFGHGTLEFLVDKNALKSDYDYARQPEYTVLRFLRSNESNFSSTIFQKMIAKDAERACKYAYGLVEHEVFERVNRSLLNPKTRVLAPEKLTGSFYMDEVIQSIFPSYVKMDKNIAMNTLDNVTKAVNKILQKVKTPMHGRNSGITAGIEHMFKLDGFLGDHEVYCPAAERLLKKSDTPETEWKIFMIKYPSMDIDEYQIAKVISRAELKRRIKDSGISESLKAMFINYYCSLHESVMVVPGCELFKKMLAGSDFDTDQVCWSMDKELISILDHEPIAIVIED